MIIQILIAQCDAVDPLLQQLWNRVLDEVLTTVVGETTDKALRYVKPPVNVPQKQRATVGGDMSTIKCRRYLPSAEPLEFDLNWCTMCLQKAVSLLGT